MSNISVSTVGPISDPKLSVNARSLADLAILGAQKAMAHQSDPQHYPLPDDATSFERIFATFVSRLPDKVRAAVVAKASADIRVDPFRPIHTAALRGIDLHAATSVETQARRLESVLFPKMTPAEFRHAAGVRQVRGVALTPRQSPAALTFTLRTVRCDDETGWTDWGSDDMYLGGAAIDPFGNASPISPISLGVFDSGDQRDFNVTFAAFDLAAGRGWPRSYYAVVVPSNKNVGGLWDLINQLVQKVRDWAATTIGAAAGAYAGAEIGGALGSIGGPLGSVIGAAVGAAVGAIVGWLINEVWGYLSGLFNGHIFLPITYQFDTQYYGNPTGAGTWWGEWKGDDGHYRMWFDLAFSWGYASVPTAISVPTGVAYYQEGLVFEVAADSMIRAAHSTYFNGPLQWSNVLGGQSSPDSPVSAVSRATKQVDVFVTGLDGRVWTAAWNGDWAGWWPVLDQQCILGTSVAAVSRGPDQLDIFVVGPDGQVYTAAWGPQTNSQWAGWWQVLDGKFPPGAPISAVSCTKDEIDIFVVGTDGGVYGAAWGPWTNFEWHGWWRILDGLAAPGSLISAVSRKENQIDIFGLGTDGGVYTAAWSPNQWGGWWRIGDTAFKQGTPITSAAVGPERLFVAGVTTDQRVSFATWGAHTNNQWSSWAQVDNGQAAAGSPVALCAEDSLGLHMFITGLDSRTWRTSTHFPGKIPVPGQSIYPNWAAWLQSPTS